MSQRFEGRNLEEALGIAADTLGVERYRLTYHVVVEKRGFLGGSKRVVIEAEVNDAAIPAVTAAPIASSEPRRDAPPPRRDGQGPRRDRPAPRGGGNVDGNRIDGNRRDRPAEGRSRSRGARRGPDGHGASRPRRDEPRREDRPKQVFDIPVDIPEQTVESDAAAAVRGWCNQVLALAKFEVELRSEERDVQIFVRVYGRDAARLLENDGELLDALQVLANKALGGGKVEKDIEIDCASFKEHRLEELGVRARATAERVARDGREELLPAMTPIERRIVHLALQDHATVTTESRGDGFFKRVAVLPRRAGDPPSAAS